MTIKKRVFGRSQFSNEIKNLPQEYGDRMLMQYPLIDKGNIGEEPANKIYKMYHVPLFAPMHRSLFAPFYHIMITAKFDNPIQEEELMEHIVNYKSDVGDYFFEHIVSAIKEAQENHYVVQIANPFEFSFFWIENGRFFFRNTSPIVLSPYAAPYSKNAIFMSEGYSDSLSSLFAYVMAENVEKKLAIDNLAEWAIKMNYLYHVKAIMGEYTNFASEKYMYETYKGDLLDIEEQIVESIYESLDTGDMDYDPRALLLRNLSNMKHRFYLAYESAVKSMSIYYLPHERRFYLAPDLSLHYHIYEEEDGYYTPLKVSECEKAAEIVANSLEGLKGLDRSIAQYKAVMEAVVGE